MIKIVHKQGHTYINPQLITLVTPDSRYSAETKNHEPVLIISFVGSKSEHVFYFEDDRKASNVLDDILHIHKRILWRIMK